MTMDDATGDGQSTMRRDEIQAEIDNAELTTMAVADLLPADTNPRINTQAAKSLARTVEEIGWGAPVLVQKASGKIIAGHTRHKAATQLGLERVPVLVLDVDDRRAKALQLADNRLGELATWDWGLLAEELSTFGLEDAEALGFDAKYLEDMADKVADFGPLEAQADEEVAALWLAFSKEQVADLAAAELVGTKAHEHVQHSIWEVQVEMNKLRDGRPPYISMLDRWFPHRYDVVCGKFKTCVNDSLQDEDYIRRGVLRLIELGDGRYPTLRGIVSMMTLFGIQTARQFPFHTALEMYKKYAPEGGDVLDPCSGWGSRLVSWNASGLGGTYTGFDASLETVKATHRMIEDLGLEGSVTHSAYEDVLLKDDSFDFAFTSPPYFTVERYSSDEEQSCVRYAGDYQSWHDGFLEPMISKTVAALKPGSTFVLNVSDAYGNKVVEHSVALLEHHGAQVETQMLIDVGAGSSSELNKGGTEDLVVATIL